MNENELLIQFENFLNSDSKAFGIIFSKTYNRIYYFINKVEADEMVANHLLVNIYANLYNAIPFFKYTGVGSLNSWIISFVVKELYNHFLNKGLDIGSEITNSGRLILSQNQDDIDLQNFGQLSKNANLINDTNAVEIADFIYQNLSMPERICLLLRICGIDNPAGIANPLGVSPNHITIITNNIYHRIEKSGILASHGILSTGNDAYSDIDRVLVVDRSAKLKSGMAYYNSNFKNLKTKLLADSSTMTSANYTAQTETLTTAETDVIKSDFDSEETSVLRADEGMEATTVLTAENYGETEPKRAAEENGEATTVLTAENYGETTTVLTAENYGETTTVLTAENYGETTGAPMGNPAIPNIPGQMSPLGNQTMPNIPGQMGPLGSSPIGNPSTGNYVAPGATGFAGPTGPAPNSPFGNNPPINNSNINNNIMPVSPMAGGTMAGGTMAGNPMGNQPMPNIPGQTGPMGSQPLSNGPMASGPNPNISSIVNTSQPNGRNIVINGLNQTNTINNPTNLPNVDSSDKNAMKTSKKAEKAAKKAAKKASGKKSAGKIVAIILLILVLCGGAAVGVIYGIKYYNENKSGDTSENVAAGGDTTEAAPAENNICFAMKTYYDIVTENGIIKDDIALIQVGNYTDSEHPQLVVYRCKDTSYFDINNHLDTMFEIQFYDYNAQTDTAELVYSLDCNSTKDTNEQPVFYAGTAINGLSAPVIPFSQGKDDSALCIVYENGSFVQKSLKDFQPDRQQISLAYLNMNGTVDGFNPASSYKDEDTKTSSTYYSYLNDGRGYISIISSQEANNNVLSTIFAYTEGNEGVVTNSVELYKLAVRKIISNYENSGYKVKSYYLLEADKASSAPVLLLKLEQSGNELVVVNGITSYGVIYNNTVLNPVNNGADTVYYLMDSKSFIRLARNNNNCFQRSCFENGILKPLEYGLMTDLNTSIYGSQHTVNNLIEYSNSTPNSVILNINELEYTDISNLDSELNNLTF